MTAVGVGVLVDQVRDILVATRERGRLPSGPAAALDEAIASVEALTDQLERLQQVVLLEEWSPDDDEMDRARAQWMITECERPVTGLQALVSASPTLSVLHKAGVTIESAFRYGDDKLALAASIGDWLGTHPGYVRQLADDRFGEFLLSASAVEGMTSLLARLTSSGAITGFEIEGSVQSREGSSYWRKASAIQPGRKVTKWRVKRGEIAAGELKQFLRGHWLTAYAYGIALDQFARAGEPFEIYSNVQYRLPTDILRREGGRAGGSGRSDIDVLVRTADVMLCIECKSGRVLTEHKGNPSAVAKTVQDANRLEGVLETMQVGLQRHYKLMHVPTADEHTEAVEGALAPTRVRAVTPGDLRLTIQRIATGQVQTQRVSGSGQPW